MDNPYRAFSDYISAHGLKNTPQRKLIMEVFFNSASHLSTDELYEKVKLHDSSIGLATVYRTLKLLHDARLAKGLQFRDGITRYEPVLDDSHHDHLICQDCGKNIDVVDDDIERLQEELAEKHGFELISHRMYLYGVCPECRAKHK